MKISITRLNRQTTPLAQTQENPYADISASSVTVAVAPWSSRTSNSLAAILRRQGFSHQEIYVNGSCQSTLIQRVLATNKLNRFGLLRAGQILVIPSKSKPALPA